MFWWAWSLIRNGKPIILLEKSAMGLKRQRPLHMQGDVISVNRVADKNNNYQKIMEGQGGGEAQGVADA
jgi:hypothetical protein